MCNFFFYFIMLLFLRKSAKFVTNSEIWIHPTADIFYMHNFFKCINTLLLCQKLAHLVMDQEAFGRRKKLQGNSWWKYRKQKLNLKNIGNIGGFVN